jgi:hypothetical protein
MLQKPIDIRNRRGGLDGRIVNEVGARVCVRACVLRGYVCMCARVWGGGRVCVRARVCVRVCVCSRICYIIIPRSVNLESYIIVYSAGTWVQHRDSAGILTSRDI